MFPLERIIAALFLGRRRTGNLLFDTLQQALAVYAMDDSSSDSDVEILLYIFTQEEREGVGMTTGCMTCGRKDKSTESIIMADYWLHYFHTYVAFQPCELIHEFDTSTLILYVGEIWLW